MGVGTQQGRVAELLDRVVAVPDLLLELEERLQDFQRGKITPMRSQSECWPCFFQALEHDRNNLAEDLDTARIFKLAPGLRSCMKRQILLMQAGKREFR